MSDLEVGRDGLRIQGRRGSVTFEPDGVRFAPRPGAGEQKLVPWEAIRRLEIDVPWRHPVSAWFWGLAAAGSNSYQQVEQSPTALRVMARELWRDHRITLGASDVAGWQVAQAIELVVETIGPEDFERADWTVLADPELARWVVEVLPTLVPKRPWYANWKNSIALAYSVPGRDALRAEVERRVDEVRRRRVAEA